MNDEFNDIFNQNTNSDHAPIEANEIIEPTTEVETVDPQEAAEVLVQEQALEADDLPDTTVEEDNKTSKSVPLATFLDMRDRAKTAEKLAEERQKLWDDHRKSLEPAYVAPDPSSDPTAWVKAELLNQKMQMSHAFALKNNDPAEVEAAIKWARPLSETNPAFDQQVVASPDPVSWIIQQHKAEQKRQETAALLAEFESDPVAVATRILAAQHGTVTDTAPVTTSATAQPAAKVRPTSLKDIPASTSKPTVQSETESFNSIFNKR